MSSDAEKEIRQAVVDWCRANLPTARIIHELNVDQGANRADVAAVEPDYITMFEIKSERDTLKRAPKQLEAFHRVAHEVYLVTHHSLFKVGHKIPDSIYEVSGERVNIWKYPEQQDDKPWQPPKHTYWWPNAPLKTISGGVLKPSRAREPWAAKLLDLLWKEELLTLARGLKLPALTKHNKPQIINLICSQATGDAIVKAACAALRAREFAVADAPIPFELKRLCDG